MSDYRSESDSMGEVNIPADAYWGAQTQRASINFSVSPLRIPDAMLHALAVVKAAAAESNKRLNTLDSRTADAIVRAAREIQEGRLSRHFPVDVFQTGSGTSWNMNINEVIANRANELLGGEKGRKSPVHPNDHVNKGQSSNDVIPTAINIACRVESRKLLSRLTGLRQELEAKAGEFQDVLKLGRTHLQDAVPMTLGQEFSGFAEQIRKSENRIKNCFSNLEELPIGGTAIGTGLNAHEKFPELVVSCISSFTGFPFRQAPNKFEGIAARDAQAELMGALNVLSVSLMKICQDLRLLSSGPRSGLNEISLPSLQPGSSIMPGKINPVIPEMVIQAAAHVMGKHLSVTIACQNGPLELNIMQPLIAYEVLFSLSLLRETVSALQEKCINGIRANTDQCAAWIENSLALVTPLALKIGYDRAAHVAYKAFREGISVRELVIRDSILSPEEAKEILDPGNMIGPSGS